MHSDFIKDAISGKPTPFAAAVLGSSPIPASPNRPMHSEYRDVQFILDLEPLEGRVNSQILKMLATVSIEMADMVRIALDCYIESNGQRNIDFHSRFNNKVSAAYMSFVTTRTRHDNRYSDMELLQHFYNVVSAIYTILYEHIVYSIGNTHPGTIILLNSYYNLSDAIALNLSLDYLPF